MERYNSEDVCNIFNIVGGQLYPVKERRGGYVMTLRTAPPAGKNLGVSRSTGINRYLSRRPN